MITNHYKIDWLSFTFPCPLLGAKDTAHTLSTMIACLDDFTKGRMTLVLTDGLFQWQEGQGFYPFVVKHPHYLFTIKWRDGNPHAMCEFSGMACDQMQSLLSVHEFVALCDDRCTRIDLAVDIETEVRPIEFSWVRGKNNIVTNSIVESPTGVTVYCGSRKSERMARVYKFNEPHPRSKYLRVECEYKGGAAKELVKAIELAELKNAIIAANLPFAWEHPVWNPEGLKASKIPARAYDREGAATLKWLLETVAPALRKAHNSGIINLSEWITENLTL